MSKQKVNETQYAKLVHEKMQEHEMCKNGMGARLNPENSDLPSGLTAIGNHEARAIMSWAEKEVQKEYELIITQRL